MGGLFSTEQDKRAKLVRQRRRENEQRREEQRREEQRRVDEIRCREELIRNAIRREEAKKREAERLARQEYEALQRELERIRINYASLVTVLETEWISRRAFEILPPDWSSRVYDNGDPLRWRAKLRRLDARTAEFERIARSFERTTRGSNLAIDTIDRIENPALYALYTLKKEELTSRYGKRRVAERKLFHGTRRTNADSICVNNLDWRRHGGASRHTFGKGVSLSPIAKYASHYCDKHGVRAMFVFSVIVGPQCHGTGSMDLPPKMTNARGLWYDSTRKPDGHVIVKYADHEFCPRYIIGMVEKPAGSVGSTETEYAVCGS